MYFNFENYESKGGSKEHFLNSFTKNYDLENDTYERVQKGIENFNKENNTSFDLYDYLKFNSKKIKFKKKEPLQEQGKEDLKQELAEQKEPLQDENLEENKSFKRKHDLSKESEILNDTSLLSDVKNSLKRGAETLSDVVGLDELVNFDSDIKSKADENIKDLIKQGASYEDLNELEKNYLANKESRENVRDATNIFSKEKSIKGLASLYGTNEEEKAKKAFAEMKSTQEALSKEKFEDLNEQEKELIDKERGAVESFFVNLRDDEYKQKSFDELKEKYEAKNFISKDVLRDLEFLKNIHQSKSVSSLILSADEKEKKDYENSVLNIALNAGFDDVLVDEKEGKMYFEKEGQKYLVNEGFFDNFTNTLLANTGSITGGLIGAAKGASSAKSPQSALAKSIAYSALGSGIGASADVLATNYLLDRKNRFDEMLHHALEESALSAVGDALVLGAKPLLKTAKDSIKDFGKILDYTPLVSTTKNFPTQNIKAAQDLVEKSVDLNTQKELDEFYKAYGGRSDLADSKALDALVDTFKAKFGEDSFISKNTQKLNDILNLNSLSAKQNALFEAIRADESGFLLPYIKEVASYDVKAFKNLKNILNLSTAKLESSLKNLNLNKGDIKNILDELESGTKDSYNEAMNEILAKTYDDRFKVVLSRSVTPEATSSHNLDSVMTKTPSNYSTLKQNLQEDYDLLDKTKPLRMARKEELNDELLKRAMEGKNKLYIANANLDLQTLGLNKNKDIKITLSSDAMRHILNKHSKDDLPVSLNDFKMIDELINNADLYALSTSKDGQKALLTGKQINGHFIAIETISTKDNELKIKTMYKSNGKLENAKAFKEAEKIAIQRIRPNTSLARSQVPLYSDAERLLSIENNQAVRSLSPKPSANLDNSHLSTLNNYTTFRKNLQEQGLLDEEAMKFLNYVESTIYNPKGVTFTQLNNALKNINSFYKQSTNPGFKEHIKNAVQSFLREDIKKGINEIFKQDKNLYAKASKLYETSLAEYAQMKELLKASAYKKARNESTTQVKALDELIKYSKGQGKDGLNNLDFLRAKLDEKDVAILEMNLLNRLYEKSLANTDESLRVFDSTSFLNELSTLQNNAFKSKEANEFIELVKGFDKLFKNDAKIALELAPVTAKKEGSALATSAKGAVLQKVVKSGFDLVFRNLGQNVLFGAFKDSIQGAALRYHLKKALQKSDTISEFNNTLRQSLKKGTFNSKTKELSKEFLNEVDKFSKSLDEEVLKDTKLSDESLKDLPKDLQEQWIKEFNLKSVDDEFIPNFKPEVKEALEKAGIDEIKLTKGSLVKLAQRDRLEFLPFIKDTLENSDVIIKDKENVIIFAKDIGHTSYFTSVAKDDKGEWIIATNSYKKINQLKNRVNNAGELLYLSKEAPDILAEAFTAKTFPSELNSNSTTNPASLSKTRELSKDFLNELENFSKNLDEEVLKDTPEIRGENFTLKPDESEVKSDFNVKMSLSDNVRDLAKLKDNEIQADLHNLALKPEMFKKPSDVFRLLKDIKENPTHFYKNNRLDASLIVKRLDDKIGKMVVKKEDGEVIHATKVDDKDLKRLEKVSKKQSDSADIIQAFTQQGSKQENQGLGYQTNSTIDKALLSKAQSKFKFDEKKASDLLEWHKDSSPITKDKEGLPKVFYHGSKVKGLEEFKSEFDESGFGFWFNANENRAKAFARSSSDKLYPVFLYIKKPFDLNQSINTKNVKELSELLGEDLHKYVATNKESLQKELDKATNSKDFAVIEGRGLMLESNKKPSEYAYAYNGKWYVNLYNETDLQREGLQKLLPFMQKAQNLNQSKTITELLNEKEMGEYQKNTHRFLQNLKAKGYDSILPNGKASDDDIIVFDSSQIKHIKNKGSYTDSSGNITSTKPKDTEAKHRYFNEKSPNIFYSNSHIGTGLASGTLSGIETDENGNIIGFNPQKFALGFLGGSAGSIAFKKGKDFLDKNPKYKEAIKKELADTLAKGWENASAKYPILDLIAKPQYIMQNEKGRVAQAGHLLKEAEAQNYLKILHESPAPIPKEVNIQEFLQSVESVANKGNFIKHLENSTDSKQRLAYLNLVEPTLKEWDIKLDIVNKNKIPTNNFIKAFKGQDNVMYYIAITKESLFAPYKLLTGFPTTKIREVLKRIKEADNVTLKDFEKARDLGGISSAHSHTSPQLHTDIITQNQENISQLSKKVQKKFNFDEKKASDLLEWHKDSSPITKDKDGLPKVFYHGSGEKFEVFEKRGWGIWLTPNQAEATFHKDRKTKGKKLFAEGENPTLYTAFVKIKNPFTMDMQITTNGKFDDLVHLAKEAGLLKEGDYIKYKDFQNAQRIFNRIKRNTKKLGYEFSEVNRGKFVGADKKNNVFIAKDLADVSRTDEGEKTILAEIIYDSIDLADILGKNQWVRNDFDLILGLSKNNTDDLIDEKFLPYLKSKGYDGMKVNDLQFVVFDSNQIKHINNKGSYTDSSGNITASKPKGVEAKHKYFNEGSPNIYQSNAHIGSGMLGGSVAGVETDENGNIIGFNPQKFALGFLGGVSGSVAVSKGFKVLKEKPELKEALKKELADTLAKGWENASAKYPLLDLIAKPQYIMQNEKGRLAQAGHILNKLEKEEAKGLYNVTYNGKNASVIYKDLENIDEAILYEKGRENPKNKKGYGAKHILKHTIDKEAQGYVTPLEVSNLGKNIREFLKHNEPFIDKNGARLYEWEKDSVRFRLVVGDIGEDSTTSVKSKKTYPTPSERIITFYSDRNQAQMQFKNPKLLKEQVKNSKGNK